MEQTVNIEELKQLILAADRQALCDTLAPLDEKQREKLYPEAFNLFRMTDAGSQPGARNELTGFEDEDWFDADFVKELRGTKYPDWRCPRWTASLMILGLSDEKLLKNPYRFDCGWLLSDLCDMPDRVLEVLDARRPKWLNAFAKRNVKEERPIIDWTVEYGLIRNGVLPTNDSEEFYRRMALAPLMSEHFDSDAVKYDTLPRRPKKLEEYIRKDPQLLETEIWKLFQYDTGAFNYSHSPWFDAVVTLTNDGDLDRQQVLNLSAQAMSGDARPKELAGYGKLHEMLEPSVEERETFVQHYLATLRSQHSAVVAAALSALEKLAKAKRLNAESFLNHCDNALRIAQKSPVQKTIRLIRSLIKQDKDLATTATEVLAIAVAHERADVQEAAIKELEPLREHYSELTQERLHDAESTIASIHASRLGSLLELDEATTASPAPKRTPKQAETPNSDRELSDLSQRLKTLPREVVEMAGADSAFASIESSTTPFVASINPGHVPRRDPALAIQPIESLEELIDTVATVIEKVDDAMEVERILDGIAMFGRERPGDFEKRVTPLRKRIDKLNEPYSRNVIDLGAQIGFSQLLAEWLEMESINREVDSWLDLDGLFFRQRCSEIAEGLRNEPRRMLALPTHRGGWIDPEILVQRIWTYYLQPRRVTENADVAAALLRLTPDGREAALAALQELDEKRSTHRLYSGGPELLLALGGSPKLREDCYSGVYRRHSAALHARLLVEPTDFEPPFPVASAAMNEDFTVRIEGPFCDDPALPERLCLFAHSRNNRGEPVARETNWRHQLEASVWPADSRPMLMLGCLDSVFDSDFTWPPEAARCVMFATCSDLKELRAQAVDALIQAIAEVRVSPRLLGEHMHQLGEHLTLKRTAEALASVGQVSDLHQTAVFLIFDEYLSHQKAISKDLHFALTPMLEAALASGLVVSETTQALLQTAKGSTKTAKLAKQVLSVESKQAKQLAARIQAASASVERAERWHELRSTGA